MKYEDGRVLCMGHNMMRFLFEEHQSGHCLGKNMDWREQLVETD